MADLSPKITNLRLARAERPDLRPERPDLRPKRPDNMRPESPDQGGGRNERTDRWTD